MTFKKQKPAEMYVLFCLVLLIGSMYCVSGGLAILSTMFRAKCLLPTGVFIGCNVTDKATRCRTISMLAGISIKFITLWSSSELAVVQ